MNLICKYLYYSYMPTFNKIWQNISEKSPETEFMTKILAMTLAKIGKRKPLWNLLPILKLYANFH